MIKVLVDAKKKKKVSSRAMPLRSFFPLIFVIKCGFNLITDFFLKVRFSTFYNLFQFLIYKNGGSWKRKKKKRHFSNIVFITYKSLTF